MVRAREETRRTRTARRNLGSSLTLPRVWRLAVTTFKLTSPQGLLLVLGWEWFQEGGYSVRLTCSKGDRILSPAHTRLVRRRTTRVALCYGPNQGGAGQKLPGERCGLLMGPMMGSNPEPRRRRYTGILY